MDNDYTWIPSAVIAIAAVITLILTSRKLTKDAGKREGSINSKIKALEKEISEIRNDIREIFSILEKKGSATETSPIRLTDMGKKIPTELNSREWVEGVAPIVAGDVTGKHPYEIQEFCFQYLRKSPPLSEEMN